MPRRALSLLALTAVTLPAAVAGAQDRGAYDGPDVPGSPLAPSPMTGSPYHAAPPVPEVFPAPREYAPPPSPGSGYESHGGPAVIFHRGPFEAVIGSDGSIHFEDHSVSDGGVGIDPYYGPMAYFTFDLTDELMRKAGDDPYLAAKLELMEETREGREVLRTHHEAAVMRRALDELPAYLAAVWATPEWDPAARRRVLFALWDEAAEDGDERVRAGGDEARATIEEFIATQLPAGSPDAYSAEELAALNRIRTSRAVFDPYAPRPAPTSELGRE